MATEGTLESIAISLAHLLKPLEEELSPGRIRSLFAELGMEFPPELETKAAFINAIEQSVNEVSKLPGFVSALTTAIANDDLTVIASSGTELFNSIKSLINNIKIASDELKNLGNTLPGISASDINVFANDLPKKIIDYLLIKNSEGIPGLAEVFEFIDVFERKEITNGTFSYTTRKLKIEQFTNFISKPATHLENLYDWGKSSFDGVRLLQTIEKLLVKSKLPVIFDPAVTPPVLDLIYLEVIPKTDISPKGLELKLLDQIIIESNEFSQDDWKVKFDFGADLGSGFRFIVQPNGKFSFIPPSGELNGKVSLELIAGDTSGNPYLIIGQPGGSRLEAKQFSVKGGIDIIWDSSTNQANGNFIVGGEIKGGKLLIDFSEGDGFLNKILSGIKLESDFEIGFGFSTTQGLYFIGSSSLEIQLPVHLNLGPVEIDALTFSIGVKDGEFPMGISANIKAALGPIFLVVEQIGVTSNMSFPSNRDGNLGIVNFDLGFKPPNGLGLSIDIGVFKGGGYLFFDFNKQEYAGALELEFQGILTLKVIGILTTKMPDGSPGFSLLLIITGEFPPIQLGFGFTLLGVGGLLGLNRTMILDVLRAGVKDNSLKSVLFPEDVIANITRIISDLKQIFPPFEGHFIVGPMAKIGWGVPTLISLELGLIIELPEPKIAILGVLKSALPDESLAILKLQVNFLGVIDFANGEISFDASLFDSRLLVYTLSGDMALRIKWGGSSMFVLSVGGFHPDFKEIPDGLTNMRRLSISLFSGDNPRITIENYFAVTSNTVQFGAKAELYAAACGFNIYGYLGFDVLFQFSPFYFIAQIYAGIALRRGSSEIMGVHVSMQLSGPTPWNAQGEATFTIIFDFSVSFNKTWGDDNTEGTPQLVDVYAEFKAAIEDNRNWKAEIPAGNTLNVSLKEIKDAGDEIIVHPFGILSISQKVVPLDFEINKFGNQKPKDVTKFSIPEIKSGAIVLATENENEEFARANFIVLSDEEKLAAKSFESLKSGKKIVASNALVSAMGVDKGVDYELSYLPKKESSKIKYVLRKNIFNQSIKGSAAAKSNLSYEQNKTSLNAPKEVHLNKEKFAIANMMDMQLHQTGLIADTEMEAIMMHDELVKNNPELKNKIQVVSQFELSEP